MGFLSPRIHGYLDWVAVFALGAAPALLHFGGVAATLSCLTAALHLVMCVATRYPLGVASRLPFPVHGTIELATALFLIASPWAFGFDGDRTARAFFIKYQDRILFGKDSFQPDEFPYYWRTFETGDEYFDYYRDYHAFWKLYGMELPDDVLKKLYYKNALKLVKGLPSAAFPQ